MTVGYSLNIERLYGSGIVRVAAKHLLRELAAELGADSHIDAARIGDNFILRGPNTAAGVATMAKSLMEAAGVTKCRKGAVTCLELLFTLPAASTIDPRRYFEQAITWAERHFGVPVLSCVVHMDEGAPHAHALLLPLIDGHMVGSDLHGGKAKLAAMQTIFHEAVGAPHGLPKYVAQKRLSAPVRAAAMVLAREKLQANAALTDTIIDALLMPHAKDPAPLLLALGIDMPTLKAKGKDFVSMMIAVCKPDTHRPIGKASCKPIGKAIPAASMSSFPDTCVGKGNAAVQNQALAQQQGSTQQAIEPASASTRRDLPGSAPAALSASSTTASDTLTALADIDAASPPDYFQTVSLAQHQAEGGAGNFSDTPLVPGIETPEAVFSAPEHEPVRKDPVRSTVRTICGRPDSARPAAHDVPGNYTRQRDADQPAEHWDSERGEFMPATGPPSARTLRNALESVTPYRPATGQKVEA